MNLEKLQDGQIIGYVICFGFKTGPGLILYKSTRDNRPIAIGRWPDLTENTANLESFLDESALKSMKTRLEENIKLIEKNHYLFNVQGEPKLVGTHPVIIEKLKEILALNELPEDDSDLLREYIEKTASEPR